MTKVREARNKFFGVLAATLFAGGFVAIFVGWVLEMIARQRLPQEVRTIEIIERDFDGMVCLKCFFLSSYAAFIAFSLGLLVLVCWGIISLLPSRQN